MKRPQVKPPLSIRDFRESLADMAADLARWVELSVEAFPSDPAARAARLAKVRDPVSGYRFFLETYLPHYVKGDASLFHEDVFVRFPAVLSGGGGARELFIAPRGSSKSTHLSLGGALHCIVLGLKRYILEVCDVAGQADLLIEAIKAELTNNPRLSADFPEVTGEGRIWRQGEIVTRNNIRVEGLGAGQKLRGRRHGPHRPDLLFFDDLENDEAVRSPEQRQKLEMWVNRAALKVGPPDGSMDVIWVGTVLHYDAVLVRASRSPVWHTTRFQAIVRWPDRMDLWDQWEEVYRSGDGDKAAAEAFYRTHKVDMDAGAVVNWPSVQPLLWLMFERTASHDAFESEYQNKPVAEGSPFAKLIFWSDRPSGLILFGALDPSLGKSGKGRDPSAILIGGYDRVKGRLDVLEASVRRRLPDVIIADVIALHRQYQCLLWFVESVQFQEFLRTQLMVEAARQGVALPAMPVVPHADKRLRIERLQPPIGSGMIRVHPTQQTLIDQLQQWPHGDHDDGPDALDMLWQGAVTYSGGLIGSAGSIGMAGGGRDIFSGWRM